jgi:hypothetical protein
MSGQFFQHADVKAKFKPLRPRSPRKITVPVQVQPRTKNYMLVGTAFDYLLRFELQRRAPHAVAPRWVAEAAPDHLDGERPMIFRRPPSDAAGSVTPSTWMEHAQLARREAERVRTALETAKAAVAAHLCAKTPNSESLADLAAHAIRLAKLDSLPRVLQFDARFEEVDREDVDDLLAMLAMVPFDRLLHSEVMLLNPTFGQTSALVGSADADLITGDMLVDFKATKSSTIAADNLDQQLGYLLLARHERQLDPTFPAINRLALYFCRHGLLWDQEASAWTGHPQFTEVEDWFFKWAEDAFGSKRGVQASPPTSMSPEAALTQPHERKGTVLLLCPGCKRRMRIPARLAELQVTCRCPACRAVFQASAHKAPEA